MHISHDYLGRLLLGFLLVEAPSSLAFVPNAPQLLWSHNSAATRRVGGVNSFTSSLFATTPDGNPLDGEKNSNSDLEAARQQLESMMGKNGADDESTKIEDAPSSSSLSSSPLQYLDDLLSLSSIEIEKAITELPPLPPLSTIERDRRNAEIQLLKGLGVTDEASSELWTLWYSERGATAKKKLEATDKLMGNPKSWNKSEQSLRELIDEYGIYFVEPLNRLATLYFLQSKFDESYKVCLLILQVKPWHLGALAGIVQVCIGRGDEDGARHWATKRLPNLVSGKSFPPFAEDGPSNPRRKEWVDQQVLIAEKQLEKVERETKKIFGKPDSYTTMIAPKRESSGSAEGGNFKSGIQEFDDDDDAWL